MHQWLVDGSGRLGLVDFERYASGEPELDVATFLVELETESPRAVGMAELAAATETGFRAAGGRLDPDRLALWTAHKRLAKVARTAAALRPDAEARASAHLDRLDLAGLGVDPVGAAPRLSRSASTRR
jgi:aminoglycoside phosphotransferase (APT) family kinase protein